MAVRKSPNVTMYSSEDLQAVQMQVRLILIDDNLGIPLRDTCLYEFFLLRGFHYRSFGVLEFKGED